MGTSYPIPPLVSIQGTAGGYGKIFEMTARTERLLGLAGNWRQPQRAAFGALCGTAELKCVSLKVIPLWFEFSI